MCTHPPPFFWWLFSMVAWWLARISHDLCGHHHGPTRQHQHPLPKKYEQACNRCRRGKKNLGTLLGIYFFGSPLPPRWLGLVFPVLFQARRRACGGGCLVCVSLCKKCSWIYGSSSHTAVPHCALPLIRLCGGHSVFSLSLSPPFSSSRPCTL